MFNPVATYRLQFHKEFTFKDFERVIPYLEKLGVSTIYASPIFKAAPESTHGYDTVDPHLINPEIGTLDELKEITQKLKAIGINWLQDIVPNHMAYHPDNKWLMDVLEKGPLSRYKKFFDNSLTDNLFKGPIMVPFLGDDPDKLIDDGQIEISFDKQLVFNYSGNLWPLNLQTYITVLNAVEAKPTSITQLLEQIGRLREVDEPEAFSLEMEEVKQQLASLIKDDGISDYFNACLKTISQNKEQLKQLAGQQFYRLCNWQETDSTINYRRFFTVNGLICLNIQNEGVFDHFHQFIGSLLKEDIVQGLRVDHIDGLYNPSQYLQRLRTLARDDAYIIVEKILEPGEEMLSSWPIQGNTGYDFLAVVNNLLTNRKSRSVLNNFYKNLTGSNTPIHDQIEGKKALILAEHMAGELDNLTRLFLESGLVTEKDLQKIPAEEIKQTISQFLIKCPVYRYYGDALPFNEEESKAIKQIINRVKESNEKLTKAADLLEELLLTKHKNEELNNNILHFYQRCMQFTGPIMAKGVEDTLMYTYNRFIDHNEVGDSPETFGMGVREFHEKMSLRQQQWPLSMNGTSTHDTKRGEDVRTRLNVLSDLAEEWLQTVQTWQQMNADIKQKDTPDANDEFFIYQTMLGAYPMPGDNDSDFAQRMEQYLEKTLREAKQHSTWAEPNEDYETAAKAFSIKLLDKKRPFWKSFEAFHNKIAGYGIVNSLALVLLKFISPGVPDMYQGCEHWDLSLVDPDNRRPVDYHANSALLDKAESELNISSLWQNKFNGQIKTRLVHTLLNERKQNPNAFKDGEYVPLKVDGTYSSNILAFARVYKRIWYVTIIPLSIAGLCEQHTDIDKFDWLDTKVLLSKEAPEQYVDLLNKSKGKQKGELLIGEFFKDLPVAILKLEQPATKRGSGVLMHISSLPAPFGIGDLGPEARNFADLLYKAGQKYWQLLPLNPVSAEYQYSPYSSNSSLAGNALFISPQVLVDEGLLLAGDLEEGYIIGTNKTDFTLVEKTKQPLFDKAWDSFKTGHAPHLQELFITFCEKEAYWLDDYALYTELKAQNSGKPWYEWPPVYKSKDQKVLKVFADEHQQALDKTKFLQFLFHHQWVSLKKYCAQLDIKLIGDLPFYVSYDSVDVWANPELFSLDQDGNMEFIAGVPPDYFNSNGQLWGMPVFNWEHLKKQKYDWWIKRIRKNMEFFDLIRLDHFRAFSSYWAVPNSEETAINGTWQPGPGSELFKALKIEFGNLPFVAEDLGDIDEAVYQLRDEFDLPGMKVLQFAFGDTMAYTPYIPHNYNINDFAYSGTHDNNTTLGWYLHDADEATRRRIAAYTGLNAKQKNIHKVFIKTLLASVAQTTIFPIQDILGLDETARMNTPAADAPNWQWRLTVSELGKFPGKKLKKWVVRYNRG